jgi:hypothetical protein
MKTLRYLTLILILATFTCSAKDNQPQNKEQQKKAQKEAERKQKKEEQKAKRAAKSMRNERTYY